MCSSQLVPNEEGNRCMMYITDTGVVIGYIQSDTSYRSDHNKREWNTCLSLCDDHAVCYVLPMERKKQSSLVFCWRVILYGHSYLRQRCRHQANVSPRSIREQAGTQRPVLGIVASRSRRGRIPVRRAPVLAGAWNPWSYCICSGCHNCLLCKEGFLNYVS